MSKEIVDVLLEARRNLSLILKRKEQGGRNISKSQYRTIAIDLKEKLQQNNANIKRSCGATRNKTYFACKLKQRKDLFNYVKRMRGQCSKTGHHETRCVKFCDAMITYLKRDMINTSKSYQKSKN